MEIAAYLLEIQFWCCPAVGNLYPIFKPHRGAFAAFPKQNDKYLTNAREGGGGGVMGMLEPVFCQESCLVCVIYNIETKQPENRSKI